MIFQLIMILYIAISLVAVIYGRLGYFYNGATEVISLDLF